MDIIESLASTASRLDKESILKKNANNANLKKAFQLALDPAINFYIKKVPDPRTSEHRYDLSFALAAIEKNLASRHIRGDRAKEYLADILGGLSTNDREVITRVIGRNLKCGVSESTVEKIWPDLKLSWPCMLVSTSNSDLKFPCYAQTKMDGMRFNAIVSNGSVEYRSRNGKELDLLGALDADFLALGLEYVVYDGELLIMDSNGKPKDRKTGNGILTKFQKGTGTESEAKSVHAVLWDVISLPDFRVGRSSFPYELRLSKLRASIAESNRAKLHNVETRSVNTMEEAQEFYQSNLDRGEEGIILKDPMGRWEDKRVKHQIKMKAELEADLLVTGFVPGTGKYEGKIGSLICQSLDGSVKVAVGTGLSDEERSLSPSEFKNKIVSIKYNALISDKKTKQKSLFLPVFIELRADKTVPDTL